VKISDERRYAEEAAVLLGGMGLQPACGKLLGWLLICDPPQQSSAELAAALALSKASVSTGMRTLERIGLARRVAVPGVRGHVYEMRPDALIDIGSDAGRLYRQVRELMDRGWSWSATATRGAPSACGSAATSTRSSSARCPG
jgi:DNA-binding transcriptional regulator GbsR (MarR family)